MNRHINVPITKETAQTLQAGDYVYITGTIYTARDAAHKRMYEILQEGGTLPLDINEQVIYYMEMCIRDRFNRGGGLFRLCTVCICTLWNLFTKNNMGYGKCRISSQL